MSRTMIAVLLSAGLGFAGVGMAQMHSPKAYPAPLSKADYTQALKDADAQYKVDSKACASLAKNAKDICAAEATGNQKVAKAQAEAAYKNTPKDREYARSPTLKRATRSRSNGATTWQVTPRTSA